MSFGSSTNLGAEYVQSLKPSGLSNRTVGGEGDGGAGSGFQANSRLSQTRSRHHRACPASGEDGASGRHRHRRRSSPPVMSPKDPATPNRAGGGEGDDACERHRRE